MSVDLLLTGANGQLGWEINRRCPSTISLQAAGRSQLDITDRGAVQERVQSLKPKVVVNAAAYTAVDKAEDEREAAFAVNSDGPRFLAEACAGVGAALIHLSTDYIFDGKKPGAYTESDLPSPLGVYGQSKLLGEEAVRSTLDRHIILRTAWVYGVHGKNFVKTMLRLGRERSQLSVVNDQTGSPTFAGDLAGAVIALSESLINGNFPENGFGAFNCVGAGKTTWYGLACRTFELAEPLTGFKPDVKPITTAEYPTPAARPANSVLDCTKMAKVHGIRLRPWENALAELLKETLKADSVQAVS